MFSGDFGDFVLNNNGSVNYYAILERKIIILCFN